MKAIILVGLARSGKDVAANYIERKHSYFKLVFSDVIAAELREKGYAVNKPNMSRMGDELRKESGMDVVARRLMERTEGKDKVVFVGARSMPEIEFIKRRSQKFLLIKISAEEDARYARRDKMDAQRREEFFERDRNDIENKGFQRVLDAAGIEVRNEGRLSDLYDKLDELLAKKGFE